MTALPADAEGSRRRGAGLAVRFGRLVASPRFQAWAARFPLTRRLVRRDGEALFDLVAGFCHSQVLSALVSLRLPEALLDGPRPVRTLAVLTEVPEARLRVLLRAAVALRLLRFTRTGEVALARRGAALVGVPGLRQMILHNAVLYRDLADPAAFLRGGTPTELAAFWPYVFGGDADPAQAQAYSDLMADSQALVAEEVLSTVSLAGSRCLLDVGGGTGAFLSAACVATPGLNGILFDLPAVVAEARRHLAAADLSGRVTCLAGSFRQDDLPQGADAASLVRVLYDHDDATVARLLSKVHAALPVGGRLLVAEPMAGARTPERAGDAYFALYTLAMGTGRTRTATEVAALCRAAGFTHIRCPATGRPFVASIVTARRS